MSDDKRGQADEAAQGGIEMEIKLVGSRFDPADILADPAVLAIQQGPVETIALRAVYFDTPDLLLHRNKAALRVRAENERFVVTAKTSGDADGFSRLEVEAPAPSLEPDRTLLLACLPPKLVEEIGDAELRAVFRTEIERRTVLLDTPAGKVELALDTGQLHAGERSENVGEAELELKSGDPIAVWTLAEALGAPRGLRPSLRSKGERGFALALDEPASGIKSGGAPLPDRVSLDEAVARILQAALRHLLENQPAAEDGRDVEGLHQLRVALRRLRGFLKLLRDFGPNPQLEEFRTQAKALMVPMNEAREWDVFLRDTIEKVRAVVPDGASTLEEKAKAAREEAYARVRAQIADPATSRFELALGVWIEEKGWRSGASDKVLTWLSRPAADFAARAIGEFHAKVLKRGKKFRTLSPPERHKVRIALKDLRYVADFFSSTLDGGKSYLRTLETLQDELGEANDLAGMQHIVRPLLSEGLSPQGHTAAGAVLGWAAAKLEADGDDLLKAWKGFKKKPVPWSDEG